MKQIDSKILDDLSAQAAASQRKRANHNLHKGVEDPVQRLCIAIEPGTYIRPNRHADPETMEVFLLLRGSAVVLLFDDAGRVLVAQRPSGSDRACATLCPRPCLRCRNTSEGMACNGIPRKGHGVLRGQAGPVCSAEGRQCCRVGPGRRQARSNEVRGLVSASEGRGHAA